MRPLKLKKFIITILLIIFVSVSLFFPKGVQAQLVVTDIPGLIFDTGKWIAEKTWDLLQYAWKHGGAIAYKNALNLYLGQIAKQTAEYVATGGKGQKPMFMTDPDYWSKMGDQVLGEWIDQTAKSFTGFTGKSLCDPIDPTIKFNMLIGMDRKYQGMMFDPDMRCSWSTLKKRYKELSKKKLIDFSVELKEGRAARYRRELAHQVEGEPSLAADVKEKILIFAKDLAEKDEVFKQNVESLKKIQEGAKKVSSNALAALKVAWEENLLEAQEQREAFQQTSLAKAAACHIKDKDAFCADDYCLSLCGEEYAEGECKAKFGHCTDAAKKTADFFNRTLDWSSELIAGAKGILDNFADFEPTPPPTLKDINRDYNPEASDVAVMFKIESELFKKQAEAVEKSKFMQGLTGDINRLTTKISNLTLTPGSGIRATYEESIRKGSVSPIKYTGVAVADAIGIFTNTLVEKLLKQVFEKGINPMVSPDVITRLTNEQPTIEETQVLYADLAVAPIKRGGEISIYDEFAVCPEDKKYALPTNCLIDNLLVRALEEGLTLQEAMDNTPTRLLPPNDKVGLPGDRDSLLSWSNIKKLRRFRIFPLGLEIAAYKLSHPEFYPDMGNVEKTLQQLVSEEEYDNPDSHFYHLVDPNWVLKNITYKCGARGYSAIPMTGSTYRQETCLDLKDCIHENDDGQCDTWAYCTREKNIWRINGDACNSQYASCQTYQKTSDKSRTAYLTNTLDFDGCDQNNAGCKWSCSNWDEDLNEGAWACVEPGWSREFSSDITCSLSSSCPSQDGTSQDGTSQDGCLCTDATDATKSCLVASGQDSCTYPVYVEYRDEDNSIFFNNKVKECSSKDVGCREYIRTAPGLGTNLIFNGSFELDIIDNNTNERISDGNPDGWDDPGWGGSEIRATNYYLDGDVSYKFIVTSSSDYSAGLWQVVQVIPGQEYTISARIKIETPPDDATINYYFDEDGVGYPTGENQGETTIILDGSETNWQRHTQTITIPEDRFYVWIGPIIYGYGVAYFDNIKFERGETASSYRYYGEINEIYLKDAVTCLIDEVGCELYTPSNSDPLVPGIIKNQDKCSFGCLGYETFQQVPSYFDAEPTQWVNLIPSSAEVCATPGCEEFTNLDTEDLEYYSYLRQCVKTNAQGEAVINSDGTAVDNADLCQQYYTWVGTETGYQLKQYYLEKATQQYTGDPDANGPVIKVSATPDIGWGDCNEARDTLINPHCKQFYDASGEIYYRLYKNTVSCTESCSLYRRTIDQTTQMADSLEAEVCPKKDVGCLEYKGPTAGNVYQVFLDDFEDETSGLWSDGINVGESINFPGHSLNVSSGSTSRSVANLVKKGKTYFISFWIKGTTTVNVQFTSTSSEDEFTKEELNPGEWQEVKSASFYFDDKPDENEKLIITSTNFYIDNIILKEVRDNPYLFKDSWKTPCECDTLDNHKNFSTGALGCYDEEVADITMVGCQSYQDREGQGHYLKSFSRLCLESFVGCESLIDTQNSTWALSQIFNPGGYTEDNVAILADELIYLVNEEEKECKKENKGCQKFGLPTLNIDQEVISYTDVYLVNDPDSYTDAPILCIKEDLGCEEYEGPVYFRDPGDKVCEYRENVAVGTDSIETGWFKKDTNRACYYNSDGSAYEPDNGLIYGIHSSADFEYENWAGLCPKIQSGCTEFIDPLAANLAVNTGLELYGGDGVPNEYIRNDGIPPGGVSTREAGEFNDGETSHKIYVPPPDPDADLDDDSGYYGLKHDAGIKVLPQTKYEVSAYIKTGTISGNVELTMHCYNSDYSSGNFRYGTSEADPGTWDDEERTITTSDQDWTKVWGRFTTLADADKCHIILRFDQTSTGTAYFDTIRFVQKDSKEASYYYLNNNKIKSAKADCQYRVGMKEGCILFNDTSQDEETLEYDSTMIYADSIVQNDLLVPVFSVEEGQGDANIVLKVRRDRTCGEWLTCVGTREVWDRNAGDWYDSCEFMARCDKLIGSGEGSGCGRYVSNSDPRPLSEALYTARDVSWSGMDYSGHSLFNLYPIELLFAKEIDSDVYDSEVYELTYQKGEVNHGIGELDRDGDIIMVKKSCKLFPEKDSPFKQNSMISNSPQNAYYKDVNVCQETGPAENPNLDYSDCQCAYKKVEYSGISRFYNYDTKDDTIPEGICVSVGIGYTIGEACTNSEQGDCGTEGYCSYKSKEISALGVRGFCLEKDESKIGELDSCLTWWPGPGVGDPDIYQIEASYTAVASRQWYCYDETGTGAEWTDVIGDHRYRWVDGTEWHSFTIDNIPDIKMKEIDHIKVRIGSSDYRNRENWSELTDSNKNLNEGNNWYGKVKDDDDYIEAYAGYGENCANYDADGTLEKICIKCRDHSGTGEANQGSCRIDKVDIHLKNGCRYMVQIPAGNNNIVKGAYTDRLWKGSSYYFNNDGAAECAPYGSASFTSIPDNRLVVFGDGLSCNSTNAPVKNTSSGLDNLFAFIDSDDYNTFTESTMLYDVSGPGWNFLDDSASSGDFPKIASVDISTCNEAGQCDKLSDNKLTIGTQDAGNIERSQLYPASLKFYAWANTNHMPIRHLTIDWLGDGSRDELIRPYPVVAKNRKPRCDVPLSFGSSSGACTDKYFQFVYTYRCEGSNSIGWNSSLCPAGVTDACCFKPKVYIRDNWDWCSVDEIGGVYAGDQASCPDVLLCSGGSNNRKRCFINEDDDYDYCLDGECLLRTGTAYGGVIIIRP